MVDFGNKNCNEVKKSFSEKIYFFNCCVASARIVVFLFLTVFLLVPYIIFKFLAPIKVIPNVHLYVKIFWSKLALWFCGVSLEISGELDNSANVFVVNHISWIDIIAIQSKINVVFVAKSEVKRWPIFGFLAGQADTLFIDRKVMAAKNQHKHLTNRVGKGDKICFFPEGTSSDGSAVLPFKSTLFQAFTNSDSSSTESFWLQPITLFYQPEKSYPRDFYAWWDEMNLALHMFRVLALSRSGKVYLSFHEPIDTCSITDRKILTGKVESVIRSKLLAITK